MPKIDRQALINQRNHSGYKQVGLAKAAGISRTYLTEIETGKKDPSKPVIAALASALRVTPRDLGMLDEYADGRWI